MSMNAARANQAAAQPHADAGLSPDLTRRETVLVMLCVLVGMLLAALDQTIVGTAMPQIVADLRGLEHYAWVATSYMLASTVTVPIFGKLSDMYGRRLFYIGGMVIFLIGSALCGMSQDLTQLIIFRGVQGLGAGAMMPVAIAIIGDIFPPSERGKWQGLTMGVLGLSTAAGPILGGWIADSWGWPWVFYVNMPIGVAAVALCVAFLPRSSRRSNHNIDYLGAAALIGAATPLLLGFSWAGTEYAWGSPQVIGLLSLAAVMTVAFVLIEMRAVEPILSPSLFRNRIFSVSVFVTFVVAMGMFGATLYVPLFIQAILGESATSSGLIMTPMMIAFIVSVIIGGQLLSRTGRYRRQAIGGIGLATVGMLLLSRMDVGSSARDMIINMTVLGLGLGIGMTLFTIVVQNAFSSTRLGEVSSAMQFFRSIGGTIGIAVFGSIMTNRYRDVFDSTLDPQVRAALTPDQVADLRNPQVLLTNDTTQEIRATFDALGSNGQMLYDQFMVAVRESLTTAITSLFAVGALAMFIGFVVVCFLPEIPLRRTRRGGPETPAEPATDTNAATPLTGPPAPATAD